MDSIFVDTNVFLRFLTDDDPAKAARAGKLFRAAVMGKARLRTSILVIAEMVWTLESYYGLTKTRIADMIGKILATPNLECDESMRVLQALDTYAHENVAFFDAYDAFYMKDLDLVRIATFDRKHFGRIPWLETFEP